MDMSRKFVLFPTILITHFFFNHIANLRPFLQKEKHTSVEPQKGKTDRDDGAVDSIGRRVRCDDECINPSKNIAAEFEVSMHMSFFFNHIANTRFFSNHIANLCPILQKAKHRSVDADDAVGSIGRRVRRDGRKKNKSSLLQSEDFEFYTPVLRRKGLLLN